jgi:flagellar biogenesis protein FliO
MRIVDTLRIDPKNRVCVLDYGDRRLLLGISPSAITLLDAQNLDATEIAGESGEAELNKPAFKQQLGALLKQRKD